ARPAAAGGGPREGFDHPGQDLRRYRVGVPDRGDRQGQDARPERLRHRGGQAAGQGHRPEHGHQSSIGRASRVHLNPGHERRKEGAVMAKGKKYVDAVKRFDRDQFFTPSEAIELVKSLASAKFDETVELAVALGVDPRKADQVLRGTVSLPAGTGKAVRVGVFAAGEAAAAAREAGADVVGADDLAAEIEKGNINFDVAIATP